jgi:hypothetical protein
MTIHVLKADDCYWQDVRIGAKAFEVRIDDRQPRYETGDVVILVNTGPAPWTGARVVKRIGYLARGGRIPSGFCVFELAEAQSSDYEFASERADSPTVSK